MTRERLLEAAARLFVDRGYQGTSIAGIEAAVGLSPGSGALYRHFRSKEELMIAVTDRLMSHAEAVSPLLDVFPMLPLGDLRAELTLIARASLAWLDNERDALLLLLREGRSFPSLLETLRIRVLDKSYAEVSAWLQRLIDDGAVRKTDADAIATVGLGALAYYGITRALFRDPPLDVDAERLVAAWVELMMGLAGN